MDELVEPTTLVDIQNILQENFVDWTHRANPYGDDDKVYAFNAMHIIQEISRT